MQTILIVDDNKDMQFTLSNILKEEGYKTIAIGEGRRAIKEVKTKAPDMILLDIKLPDMDGMKVLEEMKKIDKDLVIIMLTAFGDVKSAVRAMKEGAFHYITKPFDNEELVLIIKKAFQSQYLSREVENLKKRLGEAALLEERIGESPQIKQVLRQVEIIAPTAMTVILQGESGTGKELFANMIHQKSLRKEGSFIPIDCGAIPETLVESELFGFEKGAFTGADSPKEGRFEQANGGTLFLDEITNLPDSAQIKLLRVIEERRLQHLGAKKDIKVDVRIIIATNSNLFDAVTEGKFRKDLFHRLNEFHIELPALRDRKDDIPILAKYFIEEANQDFAKKVKGISSETMRVLLDYHWPGNVRELKNAIKKGVLLADSDNIKAAHIVLTKSSSSTGGAEYFKFDQHLEKGLSLREITKNATKQIEQDIIKEALAQEGGNKTRAAKLLKIDRMTLYSKIKEFQLE